MAVLLKTVFVGLAAPGAQYDPAGCWYACASMLAHHFRTAPRVSPPDLARRDLGGGVLGAQATGHGPANVGSSDHELLAQQEQWNGVPRCDTAHQYSLIELEDRLRTRGPILFYWMKQVTGRYGHVSVMIGTDATGIIHHDPENAPAARMSIDPFNATRQRWRCALMQRG
jgi:hypothetical protein